MAAASQDLDKLRVVKSQLRSVCLLNSKSKDDLTVNELMREFSSVSGTSLQSVATSLGFRSVNDLLFAIDDDNDTIELYQDNNGTLRISSSGTEETADMESLMGRTRSKVGKKRVHARVSRQGYRGSNGSSYGSYSRSQSIPARGAAAASARVPVNTPRPNMFAKPTPLPLKPKQESALLVAGNGAVAASSSVMSAPPSKTFSQQAPTVAMLKPKQESIPPVSSNGSAFEVPPRFPQHENSPKSVQPAAAGYAPVPQCEHKASTQDLFSSKVSSAIAAEIDSFGRSGGFGSVGGFSPSSIAQAAAPNLPKPVAAPYMNFTVAISDRSGKQPEPKMSEASVSSAAKPNRVTFSSISSPEDNENNNNNTSAASSSTVNPAKNLPLNGAKSGGALAGPGAAAAAANGSATEDKAEKRLPDIWPYVMLPTGGDRYRSGIRRLQSVPHLLRQRLAATAIVLQSGATEREFAAAYQREFGCKIDTCGMTSQNFLRAMNGDVIDAEFISGVLTVYPSIRLRNHLQESGSKEANMFTRVMAFTGKFTKEMIASTVPSTLANNVARQQEAIFATPSAPVSVVDTQSNASRPAIQAVAASGLRDTASGPSATTAAASNVEVRPNVLVTGLQNAQYVGQRSTASVSPQALPAHFSAAAMLQEEEPVFQVAGLFGHWHVWFDDNNYITVCKHLDEAMDRLPWQPVYPRWMLSSIKTLDARFTELGPPVEVDCQLSVSVDSDFAQLSIAARVPCNSPLMFADAGHPFGFVQQAGSSTFALPAQAAIASNDPRFVFNGYSPQANMTGMHNAMSLSGMPINRANPAGGWPNNGVSFGGNQAAGGARNSFDVDDNDPASLELRQDFGPNWRLV